MVMLIKVFNCCYLNFIAILTRLFLSFLQIRSKLSWPILIHLESILSWLTRFQSNIRPGSFQKDTMPWYIIILVCSISKGLIDNPLNCVISALTRYVHFGCTCVSEVFHFCDSQGSCPKVKLCQFTIWPSWFFSIFIYSINWNFKWLCR